MKRLLSVLCLICLPLLTGCADQFDAQCDHLSESDEQVSCLDLAFVQLRIGNTETPDREDLRGDERACTEGDELLRGEDRYRCSAGQWELYPEDDDEDDWDEDDWDEDDWDEDDWDDKDEDDREDLDDWDEDDWDEDDWDEKDEDDREDLDDWDEEDEDDREDLDDREDEDPREQGDRDFCELLDDRSQDRERCDRVVRDLDGLHERIRQTVRQNEDADERRRLIREGLRDGRRLVQDETRSHPERDVSREEEERRP